MIRQCTIRVHCTNWGTENRTVMVITDPLKSLPKHKRVLGFERFGALAKKIEILHLLSKFHCIFYLVGAFCDLPWLGYVDCRSLQKQWQWMLSIVDVVGRLRFFHSRILYNECHENLSFRQVLIWFFRQIQTWNLTRQQKSFWQLQCSSVVWL